MYKARGDWPRLIAVYEIEARHAVDPEQKIAFYKQIADGYEVGLDDPERALRGARLGAARGSAEPRGAGRDRAAGARAASKLDDLVGLYSSLVTSVPDAQLKNALYHKIARLYEVDLGIDEQAAEAYAAALDVSPRDIDAANALEQLYLRRGDYPNLVELLLRKADIVGAPRSEEGALLQGGAALRRGAGERREGHRRLPPGAQRRRFRSRRRSTTSSGSTSALSRWADLKDVYGKKAELAQNPQEKKQMLFVLGQVYDRELGDKARAIETYTSIVDLDPDDFDAAQALDRLYLQTERWYDLLAVLERQTELAPAAAEVVSLRFRIGELWREHLKDLTRAVEAYRQVLAMDPTHEPTLRALEGADGRPRQGAGAGGARCSSRSTRPPASGTA